MSARERVELELAYLEDHAAKLSTFIYSPARRELSEEMQDLLKLQYQTMTHYADILRKRLEIWGA